MYVLGLSIKRTYSSISYIFRPVRGYAEPAAGVNASRLRSRLIMYKPRALHVSPPLWTNARASGRHHCYRLYGQRVHHTYPVLHTSLDHYGHTREPAGGHTAVAFYGQRSHVRTPYISRPLQACTETGGRHHCRLYGPGFHGAVHLSTIAGIRGAGASPPRRSPAIT